MKIRFLFSIVVLFFFITNIFPWNPKVKGDKIGGWTALDMTYIATWNGEEVWERKHSTGVVGEIQYKFHDLGDNPATWWG